MAESNDASAPEGAPLSVLDASSLSGQSKSSSESFQEFDEIDLSNKDKYFLICIHCKCKVMRASVGTLIQKEVSWLDGTVGIGSEYKINAYHCELWLICCSKLSVWALSCIYVCDL